MNKSLLYALVALIVLVGGFFALNSYIYNEKQADFVSGETVVRSGVVLAVDLEPITYDGPALITLDTGDGPVNVAVPSMGLPLCPAAQNIMDYSTIKAGDTLQVKGTVAEDGAIVPCESADHYLRLAAESSSTLDYKDAEYSIDGNRIRLTGGISEEAVPGSSAKVVTKYFGNLAKGDLNGDSIPDLAFLLTQTGGGTGTFYYIVAALQNEDGGYTGTNGILLGDRIAPQTTEYKEGKIIVNYADRKPHEPMTAKPSVGVSRYFGVKSGGLFESSVLTGTYTCLPHTDTSGPQTLECALGIQVAPGIFYALDFGNLLYTDAVIKLATGTVIKVEGSITPIEQVSSNHWMKYNVQGIMKVEKLI